MEPLATMGATRVGIAARSRATTGGDNQDFEAALTRSIGKYDQASSRTTKLIRDLWDLQGMTAARTVNGQYGVHGEDIASDRDRLLSRLTAACDSLFADYGIDTRQDITFGIGRDGRIVLAAPHSQSARIEELVNGSPLIRNSIAKVLHNSQLLAHMNSVDTPGVGASGALTDAMYLSFSDKGKGLAGTVRTGGAALAREDDDESSKADGRRHVAGKPIGELLNELAGLSMS